MNVARLTNGQWWTAAEVRTNGETRASSTELRREQLELERGRERERERDS